MDEGKDIAEEAERDLEELGSKIEIELSKPVLDKNGESTKVLEIDTDKPGIMGMFMDNGNPFELRGADINEDTKKLGKYLSFMANVDLGNEEIAQACGWDAISKAREHIRSFFIIRLASAMSATRAQAS